MADTLSLSLITDSEIDGKFPYYMRWEVLKALKSKGKEVHIYHADFLIDTSAASYAETTAPSNVCLDFNTPKQVYLRSDNAADTSKNIDVIGQKSDGSFGQFTLTSDASDGTTPVDCGEWYFIAAVIKNDTWAGNAILDDDGAGTTVYFSQANGASSTSGIIVVPEGYNGCLCGGYGNLLDDPGTAANGIKLKIDDMRALLSRNSAIVKMEDMLPTAFDEKTRISMQTEYVGAAVETIIHLLVAVWR